MILNICPISCHSPWIATAAALGSSRDPVLAADGWTYERRALEKYMARPGVHGLPKSPATCLPKPWLGGAGRSW